METKFSLLYTAINEKVANEDITLAQAEMLKEEAFNKYVLADDEYISEGVTAKLKEMKQKLKEIRDKKPKEYDGPEEVKKFIDSHYDDIVKAASTLEKEPEKLRKDDVKGAAVSLLSFLGGNGAALGGIYLYGSDKEKLGFSVMIGGLLSTLIIPLIWTIVRWSRNNSDIEGINYLSKIRDALKKVDTKKLPEKYRNKMSDMITAIDDAETSIRAKLKVAKESTANMTDTLLSIYEAAADNSISSEEKDFLISTLRQ